MLAPIREYHMVFFFNDTATTEIYTLSLHDALPISASIHDTCEPISPCGTRPVKMNLPSPDARLCNSESPVPSPTTRRSEEHTSELQSCQYLVCRLLLEKKTQQVPPLSYGIPSPFPA